MIVQKIIEALMLPDSTRIDQRVPKTVLSAQAAVTASDRRLVKDGIESFMWIASLKPANIGVPSYEDSKRTYQEIIIVHLAACDTAGKGARFARLIELMHRAIPYPLLLIAAGQGVWLSIAHKRWAQNEKDKMVLEEGHPHSTEVAAQSPDAFWRDLALDKQPRTNVMTLYQGWYACLLALEAFKLTGNYHSPHDLDHLPEKRQHLFAARELAERIQSLRKQAAKTRQMARQVELNLKIKQLEAKRSALLNQIKQGV